MPPSPASPSVVRPWHGVDHAENFPVASWLVPAGRRPAVIALYRFARYADDLADEGEAPAAQRLAELDQLAESLRGNGPTHPVVAALLPHLQGLTGGHEECLALLSAFRQDVTVHRQADWPALLDYCDRSAAPVGRLMLAIFGCRRDSLLPASDAICIALQLLNFIQDSARDWAIGRLYLPLSELRLAGLDEAVIQRAVEVRRAEPALRALLRAQTLRAAAMLESGAPLIGMVPWRLGLELRGVMAGARRIIEKLAAGGFDPFALRPRLERSDALALLRLAFGRPRGLAP